MSINRNNKGYTLIEIMVVLVMIAILLAIAIPNWGSNVLKANRNEARAELSKIQLAQEQYRGNNPTYALNLRDLELSIKSSKYTFELDASDTGYEAKALAIGSQQNDTDCKEIKIVQRGEFMDYQPQGCWK